jgi:hypothetical protein
MAPDAAAFAKAGAWRLTVPRDALQDVNDVFLEIHYVGDVGRLYADTNLVDDNFFNGTPWEIGLKELAPAAPTGTFYLEVLPLRKDAPIYLPKTSWPDFGNKSEVSELSSVQAHPEYEVTLTSRPVDSTSIFLYDKH